MENIDKTKTKYFVIAIVLLILLGVVLIVHFNNKSVVNIDNGTTTKKAEEPTTSEVIKTTTKKVEEEKEEVAQSDVYMSTVDSDNKLLYNYKLTDEIKETDILISKKEEVNETLASNDVLALYDISLYDADMNKKSVKNSSITVSVPIVGSLVGYDEYKVVYITDENVISDEKFDTTVSDEYIKFTTTHLSKYGIIGTKKEEKVEEEEEETFDFSEVKPELRFNSVIASEGETLYATGEDTLTIEVVGVETYNVLYAFKGKTDTELEFTEYTGGNILSKITPYEGATMFVRVVVGEDYNDYELNTIKVYDMILDYDKNNTEYFEVESDDPVDRHILVNDISDPEEEDNHPEVISIGIPGDHVYIVDEADISKLYISGTLFIDTDKEVDLRTTELEKIDTMDMEKIVITSEVFNLNGQTFRYQKTDDGVLITRVVEEVEPVSEPVSEPESVVEDESDELKAMFDCDPELITISLDEEDNLIIEFEEEELPV